MCWWAVLVVVVLLVLVQMLVPAVVLVLLLTCWSSVRLLVLRSWLARIEGQEQIAWHKALHICALGPCAPDGVAQLDNPFLGDGGGVAVGAKMSWWLVVASVLLCTWFVRA